MKINAEDFNELAERHGRDWKIRAGDTVDLELTIKFQWLLRAEGVRLYGFNTIEKDTV